MCLPVSFISLIVSHQQGLAQISRATIFAHVASSDLIVSAAWYTGGVALSRVRRWFNLVPTLVMAACTLLLVWVRRPLVVVAIMATQNLAFGFKQAGIGPVTMELSRK